VHQSGITLKPKRKMQPRTSITFFWLDPISSLPKACLPPNPHSCSLWGPVALAYSNLMSTGRTKTFISSYMHVHLSPVRPFPLFRSIPHMRTRFNRETFKATYTVRTSKIRSIPNFRTIHATNPFTACTHVFSNPPLTQGDDRSPSVIKEQLCQTGRHFDEFTILTNIH
jgi:hypothetical protein